VNEACSANPTRAATSPSVNSPSATSCSARSRRSSSASALSEVPLAESLRCSVRVDALESTGVGRVVHQTDAPCAAGLRLEEQLHPGGDEGEDVALGYGLLGGGVLVFVLHMARDLLRNSCAPPRRPRAGAASPRPPALTRPPRPRCGRVDLGALTQQ
jgi:hypothetical protein